jgi:hypothetical protein
MNGCELVTKLGDHLSDDSRAREEGRHYDQRPQPKMVEEVAESRILDTT